VLVTLASALLPGLGHLAIGKRRIALLYLVPTLAVVVALAAWVAGQGMYGVAAALVTPGALTVLFAVNILVAGWRTSAAVEAVGRTNPGRVAVAGSAVVLLLVVGVPHLLAASTIIATEQFLDETFAEIDASPDPGTASLETPVPEFTEPPEETPTPPGTTPSPSPSGSPEPTPTPPRSSRRIPRRAATGRCRSSARPCPGSARTPSSRGATTGGSTCC
jgi:hypothetical protein